MQTTQPFHTRNTLADRRGTAAEPHRPEDFAASQADAPFLNSPSVFPPSNQAAPSSIVEDQISKSSVAIFKRHRYHVYMSDPLNFRYSILTCRYPGFSLRICISGVLRFVCGISEPEKYWHSGSESRTNSVVFR